MAVLSFCDRSIISKAGNLNSYHTDLNMDTLVTAVRSLFSLVTGGKPQFRAHGGSAAENLALQNIQVGDIASSKNMSLLNSRRHDSGWFLRTFLHSYFLGLGDVQEAS